MAHDILNLSGEILENDLSVRLRDIKTLGVAEILLEAMT